jgi:hypothetical protein
MFRLYSMKGILKIKNLEVFGGFLSQKVVQVVCCRRQPKIKPLLLKIYVVVQVRVDPTESI